jgi:hypothetical protein
MSDRPTYMWHHEIHSRIANEQLVFLLAGYDPVYKRQRVLDEAKRVLKDLGIRSYSLWELIGEHDLMIQAWLPRGIHADDLTARLGDGTTGGIAVDTLAMAVDSYASHWMWHDITLEGVESQIRVQDYSALNAAWVPPARIRDYRIAGFIHETPKTRSIKFFIRITTPHKATSRVIEKQILEMAQKLSTDGPITHGVTMKVSGGASYLVTGRLPLKNFDAIAEVVQARFSESGVLEMLRCRTVTHISALYAPLVRSEQLLPVPTADVTQKPSESDIEQWLKENESDDLEFKASAFTDIDYAVGRKDKSRARAEQTHEVAKAVVGMLNASGGTVIIGVAELDKYAKEELLHVYPEGEQLKARLVIGIDSELPRSGGWDAYQRSLANGLRKAIEGEIDGWVKFHEVKVHSRTLCVIRIRRPSKWYYRKAISKTGVASAEFYGRTGGETRCLGGQGMDEFKEAHPRTTRADQWT